MKKSLIILSVFALMTACKDKSNNTITNKDGTEQVQIDEDGNEIALSDNTSDGESINSEVSENSDTSLQKNEDDTYSFRFNLKKGETYPFRLKVEQKQAMAVNGEKLNITSNRTVDFDYFVEEVNDRKFKLKATFLNFGEYFVAITGEVLAFDTAKPKPSEEDVARSWMVYKSITGQSFNMEVNDKGKVLSVTGLEKVRTNALANLKSNGFSTQDLEFIKQMFEATLGNEAIIAQFEESLNIFPDRGLKIGEKWEDSQNISDGPVKGKNTVTRTFEGIKDGKATIRVNGTQNVGGSQTHNEIKMTTKNDATITGTVDIDLESGWLKKVSITKKEDMNTTYQQGDQKESEIGTQTIITTVN